MREVVQYPPKYEGDPAHLPLLDRIAYETLDREYDVAARRRAQHHQPEPRGRFTIRTLTIVAVGAVLAITAGQTSRDAATTGEASRATLIDRIHALRTTQSKAQERMSDLRSSISRQGERAQQLDTREARTNAETTRVRIRTGYEPVTGPGLRIVIKDPPGAGSNDLVRDQDLALLANGLWSAGAEAITINGQRLTALTYIKNSAEVVHVNSRPLAPPYTVEAIGDPKNLAANLLQSPTGARFADYARLLGFSVTQKTVAGLRLPGAPSRRLRSASTGTMGDVALPTDEGGSGP